MFPFKKNVVGTYIMSHNGYYQTMDPKMNEIPVETLIKVSMFTSVIFLTHAVLKEKRTFIFYLITFLLLLFGHIVINQLFASEYPHTPKRTFF